MYLSPDVGAHGTVAYPTYMHDPFGPGRIGANATHLSKVWRQGHNVVCYIGKVSCHQLNAPLAVGESAARN